MLAYWRRATVPGVLSAMIGGATMVLTLYLLGILGPKLGLIAQDPMIGNITSFRPYFPFGIDPLVWGVGVSLVAGIVVSLLTSPPQEKLVSQLFDRQPPVSNEPGIVPTSESEQPSSL
jgi:SSS family solute:Na+ symporter/sodium/pantothenate symporter